MRTWADTDRLWTVQTAPCPAEEGLVVMSDFDPTRPFTRRQALEAGLSRGTLQGRRYRQVVPGIYVAREAPTTDNRLRAGLLAAGTPESFLSHHDAARLWGGVVPHSPDVQVSVPRGVIRRRRAGVRVHTSPRRPVRFRGFPVTSPVDTFLDLAAVLDLVDLVVLGDSLVRRGRVTPEQLVEAARTARGRYTRVAERAAILVRRGVDSPMETRVRLLIVLAGLPEPQVDVRFFAEGNALVRRLDLGYPDIRVAVEYDGEQHRKRQDVYEGDVLRHEEFDNLGWRIVVVLSKDVFFTPSRTVERVAAALRSRGVRVPRIRDDYRRYFPDRERAA